MESGEENFLFSEIEKRMNKTIKGLQKLYQATIDGDDSIKFHKKCNNISNTLVLIKTEGKRRFGGFTPIPWKSEEREIKDRLNQTFLFSLIKKKIYNLKDINYSAVCHNENFGPCFGLTDIRIYRNPINEYGLYTIPYGFDYNGDKYPLSESTNTYIKTLEYEVFQVLFL